MEIQRFLEILSRRIFTIVIVAITTIILVSVVMGFLITPVYKATAKVRVFQDVGTSALSFKDDLQGDRLMRTYQEILTSSPVLQEAVRRAGRPNANTGNLGDYLTIEIINKTELLGITFEDKDPKFARDFTNVLTDLLIEHVQNLYVGKQKSTTEVIQDQLDKLNVDLRARRADLAKLLSTGASSVEIETIRNQIVFGESSYSRLLQEYELARLNEAVRANSIIVIEPAVLPTLPVNGLKITDIILAMALGLAGGIGFALILENLDTRIHSPQQLKHLTQEKIIGVVPNGFLNLAQEGNSKLTKKDLRLLEAYRLLAANLDALGQEKPLKKIILTSSVSKEGKSMVSGNLAQVLSEQQRTIFLVECDLRRPVFSKRFNLNDGYAGLSSLLAELVTLDQIIYPTDLPTLFIITSGPTPPNPTKLLNSLVMSDLLKWIDAQAQIAILDAPPVLGLADVSMLVPKVDGAILVVNEGYTTRDTLAEAIAQLNTSKASLLGIVFVQKSNKKLAYD